MYRSLHSEATVRTGSTNARTISTTPGNKTPSRKAMKSNCGRDGSGGGRQSDRRVRFTPILRTKEDEMLTSGTTGNGLEYQGSGKRLGATLKPWIPSRTEGKRAGRTLELEDEERATQVGVSAMGKCDKPKSPDVQSTGGCDKPRSRTSGIEGDRDGATRHCDKPGRRSISNTAEGAPTPTPKGQPQAPGWQPAQQHGQPGYEHSHPPTVPRHHPGVLPAISPLPSERSAGSGVAEARGQQGQLQPPQGEQAGKAQGQPPLPSLLGEDTPAHPFCDP